MLELIFRAANLRLFDGGAAGASGGEGAGATATNTAETNAPAADSQAAQTGGENPADAGQEAKKTPDQLRSEFRDMIKGDYKDAFTQEFQKQFNSRFKDAKANQERLDSYQPIIDMLTSRYGVTDGDMEKLSRAIDADQALWQEAADKAGLTVEQYREVQRYKEENERLKSVQRQSMRQQMADRQLQVWQAQAQEVSAVYPGFDLNAEMQNPAFTAMLRAGAPMRNAYEAIHIADIKASVAKETADKTTKQVTDTIKEKGMRPAEVGGSQTGVPLAFDLKNSTAKQRAEWARRAENGESISFT